MAHYALLDENNIVTNVIVGPDEGGDTNWELIYSFNYDCTVKRTSYNTREGKHWTRVESVDELQNVVVEYVESDDQSKAFRKNFAGIGYTYDEARDAFIPLKEYDSWVFNEETCSWDPPTPLPDDHETVDYLWDESSTSWVAVN